MAPTLVHGPQSGLSLTRRQALGAMAAGLALANGACTPAPAQYAEPFVDAPEAGGGTLPMYYASAYLHEGCAIGVLVGTQEGRPIKIEGNPNHPASLGATSPHVQASVLDLWDPDRSRVVRQRLAAAPVEATARGTAAPASAASSWAAFEAGWRAQARSRARGVGASGSLRILTGPVTSPTQCALLASLLAGDAGARWHVHSALAAVPVTEPARLAFGRALQPVLHLDRARCVVALGVDPFSEGPGAVRHAMDWVRARAAARDGHDAWPQLFAAEVAPGLFGARADHRCALSPSRLRALLQRIAAPWFPELPVQAPVAGSERFEAHAVAALKAAGPDALVVAGPLLGAESQALALALQQRLGALGRTLTLFEPQDGAAPAGSLGDLVRALEAGDVDTLLVLDANPVYDAPAGLGFTRALERARLVVHAGLHVDETARLAHWHVPLSHPYEAWGDALAHDGSATLMQPAIAPLYDSRSPIELLALLADDDVRDGRALMRRQWQAGRDASTFEAFWRESLRTGTVAGSGPPGIDMGAARPMPAPQVPGAYPPDTLEAAFVPDPHLLDGRCANNAWLQELPRPFDKITWDQALMLGPRTAARLRLASGDVARLTVEGRAIDAPVWVSSLHAEDAVTVPLGGGRRAAGRVGDGVGFDANAVRPSSARVAAARLEATGRTHDFARTQHEFSMQGREPVRVVAPGVAVARTPAHDHLYPPFPSPEHAWAMAIDLDACIGCNACTVACQAENNIPVVGREQVALGRVMHWIRVDRYEAESGSGTVFQPVPCMQCEQAPCEVVCPVGATVHDSEGINVQIYNRCVGTRFCSNNCPYKVRRFNFLQYSDRTTPELAAQRNPDVTVRARGVMEKCNYCLQRIARARQHGERTGVPLVDGDVVTACQAACPTRAIRFGDLRDAASDVVQAKGSTRHYVLLEELNTLPRTTYLARVEGVPATQAATT